jgi:predicted DNA-binding ribbon-helix-helix protein
MLERRTFYLASHRTSCTLEPAFWTFLERLGRERGLSLSALIQSLFLLYSQGGSSSNFCSFLRVHCILSATSRPSRLSPPSLHGEAHV